jgi:hypothetical protein
MLSSISASAGVETTNLSTSVSDLRMVFRMSLGSEPWCALLRGIWGR